ncbi:hypothetical protein CIHG_10358 [Coccidioides immitis H538.4]|uniref:Uncharacterized protein n=1 Tax=Coccidioides immitis H538.4 TaxID=396776 RepID=A0A0J8S6Q2_COCIT|nr:hypothetical protein CIHG_10358 [Coccidioides immitis H538.4]
MNKPEILSLKSAIASNLPLQEDLVTSNVDTDSKREYTESALKRSLNFYILVPLAKLSVTSTAYTITYTITSQKAGVPIDIQIESDFEYPEEHNSFYLFCSEIDYGIGKTQQGKY